MTLKELVEKRIAARNAYCAILDAVDREKREQTAEERQKLDAWETEIASTEDAITQAQADAKRRETLAAIDQRIRLPLNPQGLHQEGRQPQSKDLNGRLRECMLLGMSRQQALSAVANAEIDLDTAIARDQAMRQYLFRGFVDEGLRERAALQIDNASGGGTLVMPEQFIARLIQDLDAAVLIRGFATVIPVVGAESIGAPSLDTDIDDADWTIELGIGDEGTSLAFGKRNLTPHPLGKLAKCSKDLLASAALSVESIIRQRLLFKFGVAEEKAFMTGSGSGRPLGIFTASDSGITTTQDISTDNTTTEITCDGLINCLYALTAPWLASGRLRWIFHRDAVKAIRKLKDGNGQYLWQPGMTADRPSTILDVPYLMSEYAPNTFTSGKYVGIVGDFAYYWIADSMTVEIQRLIELYAATNQVGFIGRLRVDGMPVLSTAFARVTLG